MKDKLVARTIRQRQINLVAQAFATGYHLSLHEGVLVAHIGGDHNSLTLTVTSERLQSEGKQFSGYEMTIGSL